MFGRGFLAGLELVRGKTTMECCGKNVVFKAGYT